MSAAELAPSGRPWCIHGDRLRPATQAILAHLRAHHSADRRALVAAALEHSDLTARTASNLLTDLREFGAIRNAQHGPHTTSYRLTVLGRWWLDNDQPPLDGTRQ